MRWARTIAIAFILSLGRPARAETLETQANRAIERGVAVVRSYLDGNGAGRTQHHKDYPEGDTALVLYTLVKSGVSADDSQVRKCVEWLCAQPMTKTYGAAVCILALDAFKDHAYDEKIQAAGRWLEDGLRQDTRRWGYPSEATDLSNTQYAALGLWAAERHGFKAREDTWATLLAGVGELRTAEGGFAYRADSRTTGSMTVAGLTVLELALARSPDGQLPARFADIRHRAKGAAEKAWSYLERRFSVEGNPLGAHALQEDWLYYYLYGVERLCAITGRTRIGEHDWYAEGARKLVAIQADDGSWGGPADTCFALLFLRRATFTTMDRPTAPLVGDGVPRAPRPAPPHADVPFVRRWLLLGPLDDPDDELLEKSFFEEARARPSAMSYSGTNRWDAFRSVRDQVDLGGPDGPRPKTITCAFVWIHAAAETDAVLWIGHDDGCRAWFDGVLVHDRHFERGYGADSFAVPVHLELGAHRFLMKVHNVTGTHALHLRIARPDGRPDPRVRTSLSPDDVEFEASALGNPSGVPLDDLLCLLPREPRLRFTFDTADELDRVAFEGCYGCYPLWSGDASKRPTEVPNPGATGLMGLHPADRGRPSTAYWKVRLPDRPRLRVRVSATTVSAPGRADAVLKVGVFDGAAMKWVASEVVGPEAAPDARNWRWIEFDLADFGGREVLMALQAANGGRTDWTWEGIWFDEIEIRSGI